MKVEESLNVTFDETHPPPKTSPLEDDDLVEEEAIKVNETRPLGNDVEDKSLENNEIINFKESKSHPLENIIDEVDTPTPIPKPPSPCNELSKESSPIAPSNQASHQPHSPLLIDPYVNVVLQANQNRNKTQPQLPISPTRDMLVDEINQL
ncbi:hypothetical protein Tco_0238042 [Tanacetum coccineum]